jgi:hypothetical protein
LRKGVPGLGQFADLGRRDFHLGCSFKAGLPVERKQLGAVASKSACRRRSCSKAGLPVAEKQSEQL